MLLAIRDKASGWIAWVIVILISIPFTLWGVNEYMGGGRLPPAATVNGEDITMQQFQMAFQNRRAQLERFLGERFDPETYNDKRIKEETVNLLIEEELQNQYVNSQGFFVHPQQIVEDIRSTPAFQIDGKFDLDTYKRVIGARNFSPALYEYNRSKALAVGQLRQGIYATAFATPADLQRDVGLSKQERDTSFVMVKAAGLGGSVSVSDDEVKAYYDGNQQEFMLPERVVLNYIELNEATLLPFVQVTDEALQAYYDSEKVRYGAPEQRKASHILIRSAKTDDEAKQKEAREKAEGILAKAKAGEDFAKLAKANSEDPGSASNGGDLGFFGRNAMVPEFEEATFGLEKGEVSELVQTDYGFHIIKLVDIREERVKPFDEVKAQVELDYKREQLSEVYVAKAEELANAAYENPESLEVAAEAVGVEIKTSPEGDKDSKRGIFADAKVRNAAYSDEVLKEGNNSELIELGANSAVVIRVKEDLKPSVKPFSDVQAQIKIKLKQEKIAAAAQKRGEELAAKIKAGEVTLESLADDKGLRVEQAGFISRDNRKVPFHIVREAFSLLTTEGAEAYGHSSAPNGDYAVVIVKGVKKGSLEGIEAAEQEQLWQTHARNHANDQMQALPDVMRERSDVSINEADINDSSL